MDRCKIRATFAPTTFEDKERLQVHGNGIETRLPWDDLYQEHKRETTRAGTNHDAAAARLSCCWIDSIGDKLFAILKSLIILSILDGSGHIYMGFVLKWFIYIRTRITF